MKFVENLKTGYEQAREHGRSALREVSPEKLPFKVSSKEDFLSQFERLEKSMRVEPLSLEEGYSALLEGNMPWRLSPETKIARLYAEEAQLGKFIAAKNDPESWRQLTPIHHEASVKRANEIWQNRKKEMLDIVNLGNITDKSRTSKLLAIQYGHQSDAINKKAAELLKNNPKKSPEQIQSDAIDAVIGQPFIQTKTRSIKATHAYYHGKRLENRANLAQELIGYREAVAIELPQSTFKIGTVGRVFFDMAMVKNISFDENGKEKSFPQGLIIQEPSWTERQRANRPVGLAILPWYEAYHEAPSGDVYVNIGLRNEPGADNYSTTVTGEQTSGSKIENGDILKQQGGAFIAVCVGEKLAVHCEQIPELTEAVPEMDAALANRDSNRIGGGHNAYASIKVVEDSPLLKQYEKNMWIKLTDLEELIQENNTERPIVNDLLLAAKDALNVRLRNQAEARDQVKTELLGDIASNPESAFGWLIGAQVNWIESQLKKVISR